MANIYELKADIQTLWNLMDEGQIDDETLIDAMKNSQEELSLKLEGYCKFIKNLEAEAKAYKAEEERLAKRRKTREKTIERAKAAMKMAMETAGEKNIPCGVFTVYLQKNPEKLIMDEKEICNIPTEYLKYKEPEIDTKKIKEELMAGKKLEGLAHLEQDEGLRIR